MCIFYIIFHRGLELRKHIHLNIILKIQICNNFLKHSIGDFGYEIKGDKKSLF